MKKLLFSIIFFIITFTSYSQIVSEEDIFQGEKLIEVYFTPMTESFGTGLNNGWYNTAKPHKFGGFDLTFTLNTVIIPNAAETFKIGDSFGGVFSSDNTEGSTIFGSSVKTPMKYRDIEFNMPGGLKIPALPIPIIQAGIGLIKNTDLDIRYIPMLDIGNNININILGAGIKHDVLQWIPIIGDAIPMSLSIQGGYTDITTKLKIDGQEISLNSKATSINLIASKKILMITGYAGIGYNSSNTIFKSEAKFNLDEVQFNENLEISFENKNDLRTNIGIRMNITLITIHADYTFSKYPTATVGIGVSLR